MNLLTTSDVIESHLGRVLKRLQFDSNQDQNLTFNTFGEEQSLEEIVGTIIGKVRKDGDSAVAECQKIIDKTGLDANALVVSEEEIRKAESEVDEQTKESLKLMHQRIREYAEGMMPQTEVWTNEKEGRRLGYRFTAVESIGSYVPGGMAGSTPLISTVLMNIVPAVVAGVKKVVVSTPCRTDGSVHPALLLACKLAGANYIYRCGGAHGIAAMAHGTQSLPACHKIIGPGNIFVQEAKRQLYGLVDIDMMAGPSEIAIIADDTANPDSLAADMIGQAEHDPMASSIVFSTSQDQLTKTKACLEKRLQNLPKKDIASTSLNNFGALCLCNSIEEATSYVNQLAPEHLQLSVADPQKVAANIQHAGAIFYGHYTPEVVGDYTAGPSHTLPTCGAAKFASGITVFSFLKSSSLIEYDPDAMRRDLEPLCQMARAENLEGHAQSAESRFKER